MIRRFRSRKTAFLTMMAILFFTIFYLTLTVNSSTMISGNVRSSTEYHPPPVAEKMSSNESSLSNRLWHFVDGDSEKLYLYNRVLKRAHSFNESNIRNFRKEIFQSIGEEFSERIIVDQKNAPINSSIRFNMGGSPRSYFQITSSFRRHIPEVARIGRLKKCSVVGNSGILINSSCGGDIDSSDFVFRYESLKTPEQLRRFQDDMREYRGDVLAFCFSTSSHINDCLRMLYRYKIAENKLVMGHPDHFLRLLEFWAERKLTRRLTTGFYFTNVAIYHCDEVHLYGFWPFADVITEEAVRSVPYHYFDDMKFDFQIKNRRTHHMDKEFSTLLQLHSLGVIKIHTNRCN